MNTARLMEDVENVRDMAQRVLNNGPEPNYAGEKMATALRSSLDVLARIDPRGTWAKEWALREVERAWSE